MSAMMLTFRIRSSSQPGPVIIMERNTPSTEPSMYAVPFHTFPSFPLTNVKQSIKAQLEVLDPGSAPFSTVNETDVALRPRATENKSTRYCIPIPGHPRWVRGYWDDLNFSIRDISRMPGVLCIAARACALISCNNNYYHEGESGTYLCNDVSSQTFCLRFLLTCSRLIFYLEQQCYLP